MIKIKKNSFINGAGTYLVSNILNAVIPFILLPILTRYLTPTEYGEVAMFQVMLGALSAFVGVVFVGAASRKYYDSNLDNESLAEFIGSCIQLIAIFSIVVFSVLFIFQQQFSEWLSLKPNYVLFAVLVASFSAIIRIRLGQWQVKKQAVKYGALQISQSLLNMILSLILVVVLLKGAEGRINAQIIVSSVFLAIALYLLKKDNLLKIFTWRKDYLAEALKFGMPLMPHIAGGFLLTTVDRIVINREIGLAEAGIYMVAVQLTAAVGIVFDAINKAGAKTTNLDALSLAVSAGSAKAVNVVLIGVMASHMDLNRDVWINAIKNTVPEKFLEMNLKAFDLGYNYNK